MAVLPVEWAAKWNDDELVTGASTTKAALASLADSTDAAAAEMKASLETVGTTATTELGTNVPAAADRSAVDLTSKASKFRSVGTELGTELAQGVAGGVDPATATVNVGSSLSGLLAASATTAKGAAAAVGLGLGVALISNVVQGIKAKQEEAAAALAENVKEYEQIFLEGLGRIKDAARKAQIEADFLDPDSVLRQAYGLADKIGAIDWADVQLALYGTSAERARAEAEIQQTLSSIQTKRAAIEKIAVAEEQTQGQISLATANQLEKLRGAESAARELAKLSGLEAVARDKARTSTERHLDALREANNLTREQAENAERVANAIDRYAPGLAEANRVGLQDYGQ
jgi:hypothetical protein